MADTQNQGFTPQETVYSANSSFNAISFVVSQMINRVGTNTLVKVIAVTNEGGVAPVGFCDVQPLVTQVDGAGNATPHGVLYRLPYVRLQGGSNAIILDPQPGDIGLAFFCMSDINGVKANKAVSPPGSGRRYSMADGIYLGGVLNGTPVQYIRFIETGIEVVSPTKITLTAPMVTINATTSVDLLTPIINTNGNFASTSGGASTFTGNLNVTGDVTASGKSLTTHTHGGVQTGGGNTGAPN